MNNSDKYLGLPMTCGKSRVNTFKELEEKILKRVLWWKEKFISKAGREVLIKTVAQAIPTYAMSLFKLPKSMCDSINSLLAKYWWGQNKEERKIHWINWKKLCTSKKEGGMGLLICMHSTCYALKASMETNPRHKFPVLQGV